ncbi:thiol reductant ABC exporter subunit CydD [Microbispora cellulosiformans]|uniref:Thiol reductant ABC exporter subunit CydD n=1 Tax=Microbispora cellulosiformans TaxID=2614688 RepID=A0A5J5K363_9ACTN|nr:thiol reductant ABC exporter subunit CydD [Microbispora cellulosiformans]KAA9377685.1 thiol reductant ABC exporter subunit CydD [Microbispora cellulosiformans]
MHKDLLRLARAERSVRRHLACCLAAAVAAGLLVLVQAELLAGVLSGRFAVAALFPLALVVAARGLFGWAQGVLAGRAATALKSALRRLLLGRVDDLGPSYRSGEVVTLAGRGLDALDPYLTGYLPSAAVAGVVPFAVVVRLFAADLATAVIVVLTLPLIPVFGALVGWTTRAVTERQWRALARLGGHFLDVVRGLPTLRAFGRARYQASVIREVAEAHRAATMRTLRVAFLSSLVLELVASLSLALVAVPVGLRLLSGSLDLHTALLVLLLAPEAYLPLRAMGTRFHAAMEGVAAADEAFAVITPPATTGATDETGRETGPGTGHEAVREDAPAGTPPAPAEHTAPQRKRTKRAASAGTTRARGAAPPGGPEPPEIRLENVTVRYPGRAEAALDRVTLVVEPGERVAIAGPSGAGKSTLLHLLLGFLTPDEGRVLVGGEDLASLDLGEWRRRLAFVPQRPHLFATSVARNIALGSAATAGEIRAAAEAAQVAEFAEALPQGYDTPLGERGANLSAGQRQRVALARAFCRAGTEVLLLDEPTARLDGRSEAAVVAATRGLARDRTAIIVAHRPAMIELADRVVRLDGGALVTPAGQPAYDGRENGPLGEAALARPRAGRDRAGHGTGGPGDVRGPVDRGEGEEAG